MAMKKLKMLEWKDGQPSCAGLNELDCQVELKVGMTVMQDTDTLLFYCVACPDRLALKAKKKPVAPLDPKLGKLANAARESQLHHIKRTEAVLTQIEQYSKEIRDRLSGKIRSTTVLEGVAFAAQHLAEEAAKLTAETIKAMEYEYFEALIGDHMKA